MTDWRPAGGIRVGLYEMQRLPVNFICDVVGFAVGEGDVLQLEWIAEEGEGLFFSARNVSERGAAYTWVVATPAELPEGR